MDLFRLLRSGHRGNPLGNPVSAVARLNLQPKPLQNPDKDVLVGAVLALGPSLQLALHILLDLLPLEESRERLAEVLCPTLGQLQHSLEDTLASLRAIKDDVTQLHPKRPDETATPKHPSLLVLMPEPDFTGKLDARNGDVVTIDDVELQTLDGVYVTEVPQMVHSPEEDPEHSLDEDPEHSSDEDPEHSPDEDPERPEQLDQAMERFPPLDQTVTRSPNADCICQQGRSDTTTNSHLAKELHAERRVNAAIQVAVDSLELAEGQLKIVKEVNRIHGGSFELLQQHFYDGYNRIIFRALQLESPGFGLPSQPAILDAVVPKDTAPRVHTGPRVHPAPRVPSQEEVRAAEPGLQRTVSFGRSVTIPATLLDSASRNSVSSSPALVRRNTVQGIVEEHARERPTRLAPKRRLSLAEELALAADESSDEEDDWEGEGLAESGGSERESRDSSADETDESDRGSTGQGEESDDSEDNSEEDDETEDDEDGEDGTGLDPKNHLKGAPTVTARPKRPSTSATRNG
ncbi:hypothetical protein B0T26DRAFT_699566 [Lasiosphaeria miniovina]|uniref:Uncharacterized protein n=1 Tax=Lasiosphaeria miniovina TaxID=1954250 RepID=A0AA40B714_9PEZI|nr:uncharacterized protein B0T26DRAFT_699566 [Lasiosphaeria miniovina]KAK0728878.1 hypothetical protein B0T26DRAFT_699566 [Lasiosphaeria miniovina]